MSVTVKLVLVGNSPVLQNMVPRGSRCSLSVLMSFAVLGIDYFMMVVTARCICVRIMICS